MTHAAPDRTPPPPVDYGPPPTGAPVIPPAPSPAPKSASAKWVIFAVLALGAVGVVVNFQPVSVATGGGTLYIGAVIAAGALVLAFVGNTRVWLKIVAVVLLALCVLNTVLVQRELNDRRAKLDSLFKFTPTAPAAVSVTTPPSTSAPAGGPAPVASTEPNTDAAATAAFHVWVDETGAHQWAANYAFLVPAQQALLSESKFEACRDDASIPALTWVKSTGVKHETSTIAGTSVSLPSTAVTAVVASGTQQTSATAHMFYIDNHWAWSLEATALALCQ